MTTKACAGSLIFVFFLFLFHCTYAQRIGFGLSYGYGIAKYTFPVEDDLYHDVELKNFNTTNLGVSLYGHVANSFRIRTGLEYTSLKGDRDGGRIPGKRTNPNSTGETHFQFDNSFLIIPVEFQILFTKNKVRPVFLAGLNAMMDLHQNILVKVEAEKPTPYYPEASTTIDKDTKSKFQSASVGTGIIVSASKRQEVSLIVYRRFNKAVYESPNPALAEFDKHELLFNTWQFTLGWNFR